MTRFSLQDAERVALAREVYVLRAGAPGHSAVTPEVAAQIVESCFVLADAFLNRVAADYPTPPLEKVEDRSHWIGPPLAGMSAENLRKVLPEVGKTRLSEGNEATGKLLVPDLPTGFRAHLPVSIALGTVGPNGELMQNPPLVSEIRVTKQLVDDAAPGIDKVKRDVLSAGLKEIPPAVADDLKQAVHEVGRKTVEEFRAEGIDLGPREAPPPASDKPKHRRR